jgi:hypothetical protein
MLTELDVLAAIREADAASTSRELHYRDVADRVGCPADDEIFQGYLVRAVSCGLIEEIDSIDQLAGPTRFRYTP